MTVAAECGRSGDSPVMQRYLDDVATHRNVFSALNSALMADGALHIASQARSEQPIELLISRSVAKSRRPAIRATC